MALGFSKKQPEPSAAVATDNTLCSHSSKKKAHRAGKTPKWAEPVTQQTQEREVVVVKSVVTERNEQIPLGVNQKPVSKKNEDVITGNTKGGPDVKKSRNLVVPGPRVDYTARIVDNKRSNVRITKWKRDWRKMRRECRPPDQSKK